MINIMIIKVNIMLNLKLTAIQFQLLLMQKTLLIQVDFLLVFKSYN